MYNYFFFAEIEQDGLVLYTSCVAGPHSDIQKDEDWFSNFKTSKQGAQIIKITEADFNRIHGKNAIYHFDAKTFSVT